MILIFSLLLIVGILAGQFFDFSKVIEPLEFMTSVCLSYIMIEVGLEFSVDKRDVRSYGWDAVVAFSAAFLPALLWFLYFVFIIHAPWQSSVLAGTSSAPTSAGILFSMMMAAGLQLTWVFKKARVLAVLDDLATILLLIPLQIILHGFEVQSIIILLLIGTFLFASFRWQNQVLWPTTEKWLLFYGLILAGVVFYIKKTTNIHIEVLIPAFMWGCLLHLNKAHQVKAQPRPLSLDVVIKGFFMLMVGFSFPKVSLASIPWGVTVVHVAALTILSNLGKSFCLFCYQKEASVRERLALSIAMFPRGEVGAAVLLIAIAYGFGGYVITLAMISLALNLVLTGVFVSWVMRLLRRAV